MSLPKILLVPFRCFYYQRLPDLAVLTSSSSYAGQCLYVRLSEQRWTQFPGRPPSKHLQIDLVSAVAQWGTTRSGFRHRHWCCGAADCWGASKKNPSEVIHCVMSDGWRDNWLLQAQWERSGWAFPYSIRSHLPFPYVGTELLLESHRIFAPSLEQCTCTSSNEQC